MSPRARRLLPMALAAVLVVGVGAGLGWKLGADHRPGHVIVREPVAQPISAAYPSVPGKGPQPYAADISWPLLDPDLDYHPVTQGVAPDDWSYEVPNGWVMTRPEAGEVVWRPAGEPTAGGFSLFVRLPTEHLLADDAAAAKRREVMDSPGSMRDISFTLERRDQLSFDYRDGRSNRHRWRYWYWATPPDSREVGLEVTVDGRRRDVPGLKALIAHVADSVQKVAD